MIEQVNFQKMNGLIPAIVQDDGDGTVLMLGFMNQEALEQTLAEHQVIFWSRSKRRLWKKGETSGNDLKVVSVEHDCDNDALLVRVSATGPVCHTGERSCFPVRGFHSQSVLHQLEQIIRERIQTMPEGSYTAKLLNGGSALVGQKVGEEAVELAIAAQHQDRQRCVEEAADLLYHALVLLALKKIEVMEVEQELERRMK
jgi:phosphoribosyl-ATP pyrophosphohydrolase/phosphoribosyl-AMP cyclohydrolase